MLSEQERIKQEMAAADSLRAGFKRARVEMGGQVSIESGRAIAEARDQVVMGGWFGRQHSHGAAPQQFAEVYGTPAATETAGTASVYGAAPQAGGSIHGESPAAASTGNESVYGTAPEAGGSIHGDNAASTANENVYGTAPAAPPSTIHDIPEKKSPEAGLGH